MLFNYLKMTFRAIRKTPVYGLLNISGLALGIACAALIFLWVEDELGFDKQYAKRNELYSIRMNIDYSGRIESYTSIPGPMPDAIRGTIPGVVNLSRLGFGQELFGLQDKSTYENGAYVDTSYFSMMQLNFTKGNATGFDQLHTLVISEKMAQKIFGNTDPVGKTIRVNNQQEYKILGTFRDPATNVSLRFDWLAPVDNFLQRNKWLNSWGTFGIITFVELQPGTDAKRINQQLTAILRPKDKQFAQANCLLWSMNDWHLYGDYSNGQQNGGQIRYVRLFSAIAWIILIIACINFMNLATARAGQRAREIGVRKTLGAVKKGLIGQFIIEALVMSFMGLLLAILLIYILLPGFNTMVEKQLPLNLLNPVHLFGLIAIGIFCGLVAGSYPAFYLSSFNPVAVLKGHRTGMKTGTGFIRKGLVTAQFTISIILTVCTIIIYLQVQHIRKRDLGYSKQNLVSMPVRGKVANHFDAIKAELLGTGVVENAALSQSPPFQIWGTVTSNQFTWQGADPNNKVRISWEGASPEYISTMGLKLKEGRDFYDRESDSTNVIINESMAKLMGKEGRLGATLTYEKQNNYHVVGIVNDFLFGNMYGSVTPFVLGCDSKTSENYTALFIRLKPGNHLSDALSKIEPIIKKSNPGYPFEYQFMDEQFNRLFSSEAQIGNLAGIFAALAIFISCLGLFGLSAYTAERRTKEIGVRKVLGASSFSLVSLLSKEFVQLVIISCLIAFPLAWQLMQSWLSDYAYRTPIYWWVFGLAGISALLIVLLTVSFQAIKAALSNPVNTLRSE